MKLNPLEPLDPGLEVSGVRSLRRGISGSERTMRALLAHMGDDLRRRARAARRRLSSSDSIWSRALPSELAFWAGYIETKGLNYPEEFQRRTDPHAAIEDPLILDALKRIRSSPVKILDVGAGPLTSVGFRDPQSPARRIEVVAVDPLADDYNDLLDRAGVSPPVRTIRCRGEDVAATFGVEKFDIGYARNALDHAAHAMEALESLVHSVRPGGVVVLIHSRREAETQSYEQLHQWNFDVTNGRFVVYGKRGFYDIEDRLGPVVTITTNIYSGRHGSWVAATMLKRHV
jgi:SAM-dependent methyltransferase